MSLAARLTRCPDPHDPERGAEAAALFPELAPELRALLAGTAGCSPYLSGLIGKERDWLAAALSDDPDLALSHVLSGAAALSGAAVGPGLRQAKQRVALLAALADLGGAWPLEKVTGALTRLADIAVDRAFRVALAPDMARGKLPLRRGTDPDDTGGWVALAMGKMGADELNYSSDIDLICLFDGDLYDPDDLHEARAVLVRATRRMTATLSELTGDGYVFRTDLRLRPDAAVTPVCLSMNAAESYYEAEGRTWERAAYIKARPAAGHIAAGQGFLDRLRPFVWRRHLDFAAIQDAHDMRLRIREHKKLGGKRQLEGHDMKLGAGGIREIEFFTQTRQLIAGGRDAELRVRGTVPGLARLTARGWVPGEVAQQLTDDYRAHREVEHRLQMIADAQTHALPTSAEGFDRLAAFMGRDATGLRAEIAERLDRVHALTEGFFAPGAARPAPEISDKARDIVDGWKRYPALRSDRAVEIFNRLRPEILARLQKAARPEEALVQFDGFLSGLPAGVQLFSLFEANPHLIDLIVDIAATAPGLAHYLGRNAQVLDAVIGGDFFARWPGRKALTASLSDALAEQTDYEARLDTARRLAREWHFRIGVHQLRGLIDADTAGRQYAELADAILAALWPVVVAEFTGKHGSPPGRGAVVLGMGSLGSSRLSAMSDLDLIVIYDAAGVEASDGRRPLAARAYYARLTQAMVTALTAPMAGGKLYEVDMRLRPSGRQGPVATSFAAFQSYQQDEAWTWEHLALTRARAVAGDAGLGRDVEAFRRDLLAQEKDPAAILADVAEMRARLASARPAESALEPKRGPGRMQDAELLAQTSALLSGAPDNDVDGQLAAGAARGWLTDAQVAIVRDSYRLCWQLQSAARLLTGDTLDPDAIGEGGRAFVLRETGMADMATLEAALAERAAAADRVVTGALGSPISAGRPDLPDSQKGAP